MAVNVTIIGADVLGLSIGLALKASASPMEVTLHDRDHQRAQQGVSLGAADHSAWNLLAAVEAADLVFLNESLHQLPKTLGHIGPVLHEGAVVTDTASIKAPVMEWAGESLPNGVYFVGGTPLVTATVPDGTLFHQKRYAILPAPTADPAAVKLVADTVTLMGGVPLFIEVAEHDALLAAVQQLPVLTSIALLQVITQSQSWKEMATMAGPLFAAAAHLPTDDPDALAAMLYHNRHALMRWLRALQMELDNLQRILSRESDPKPLADRLDKLIVAHQEWEEAQAVGERIDLRETMAEAKVERGLGRLFGFSGRRRKRRDRLQR
ncbi:MAG: prephenate dehydrogenase [Anaerolineales bacterium]|nr:prephenate dehydrogenase [Anaerolineales bacterium]MCB9126536.1 prephenate dehydrogenase [Ardenticatenales bacterium]MCB9172968.1 prephenate dehydrogenase [Ardenticatenales bacterium]